MEPCGCSGQSSRSGNGKRPRIVRPDWQDPLWVMSTSAGNTLVVVVPAGVVTQVAPASARRWAIGFLPLAGVSTGWLVSPNADPQIAGWNVSGIRQEDWYDLSSVGPFVCSAWYAFNAAGGTLRVLTVDQF